METRAARRLFAFCASVLASVVCSMSVARADDFDSAGVNIHYSVTGQGAPVVLVHGLYSSAKMNWDFPGTTSELAKHFQVITFDCRGHGQSDKPEAEGQYGTNMVEDIVRLLDHLHVARASVVGYSMGGMIVMKLLVMHPERVSFAVLGGVSGLLEGTPPQRFWESMTPRGAQKTPAACLHGMAQLAVTRSEVQSIKVPTAIIVGDRDPCRQLYVEPVARIRPDWPVHVIANAGHITCVLKPEFKTQLKEALESGAGAK